MCIEYIEKCKGKIGATISQRIPWKLIDYQFIKKTGLSYNKSKHKYENRWSLWKALKGKEMRLGLDHEKKTISAREEWWAKKFEVSLLIYTKLQLCTYELQS